MNMSSASPYSTGGGGTVLEHRYGAILLTHVLAAAPLYELGDSAIALSVKFQVGATSAVDDFLVKGVFPDESAVSASIAVRRNPLLQRQNKDSKKLMASFLLTLDQHFDEIVSGSWSLVLVSVVGSSHAQELAELVSIARDASTDNASFRTTVATERRTTKAIRARLKQMDYLVSDAQERLNLKRTPQETDELTWLLISCLRVRLVHIEGGDLSDRTYAIERLIPLTPTATAVAAEETYTRLVELCGSFAPAATEATEAHIRKHLGQLLEDDIWVEGARRKVAREPRIQRHRQLLVPSLESLRRQSRLSLGLSREEVDRSYLHEPELPAKLKELERGKLLALTGPIGSGKSDFAARWLLEHATGGFDSHTAPVPFWIRATELRGSLESHIEKSLGVSDAPDRFGVDLVLDGLDESPEAPAVLEMQTFLAKYPKSRVVLTARPGEALGHIETCEIPDWSTEDAKSLIRTITCEAHDDRLWTEELKQSVRRPLFALLAAHHAGGATTSSPAALLVAAVNTALHDLSGDPQLEELAIALTRTGRAVDARLLRGMNLVSLRSTRLVEFSGMRVRFSLPIFEQWFAAQAILSGRVPTTDYTSDLQAFAKWRYVLAIAVSSGTHETMSPILNKLARWNPAAAAWVLREGKHSKLEPYSLPLLSDDPKALGDEIIRAVEAWLCGLGPAGRALYPMAVALPSSAPNLDNLQLMISWNGDRGWVGWKPREDKNGPSVLVNADPSIVGRARPHIFHSIQLPVHESWVWDYTFDLLTHGDKIASLLLSQVALTTLSKDPSVINREDLAWRAATVLGVSEFTPVRLTQASLKQAAEHARQEAAELSRDYVIRANLSVPLSVYTELEEVVVREGEELMNDPWPGPDLAPAEGTRGYSDTRISERAKAVYEAAAIAYEEVRQALLPKFGKMLGHSATFPAVMEGEIRHEQGAMGFDYGLTSLDYWFRPVRGPRVPVAPLAFNLHLTDQHARSWDDLAEVWDTLAAHRNNDRFGSVFEIASYMGQTLDPAFFGRRPATHVAVQWLLDDLRKLGWVTKTYSLAQVR